VGQKPLGNKLKLGQKPLGNKLKPGEVKNILLDILKTWQINKILVEQAEFCYENLSLFAKL